MSAALAPFVEDLYAVFAHYPRGKAREVCISCDPRDSRVANERLRRPVRELDAADIELVNLGGHGYGTGDTRRLRHFLPRIFELASSPESASVALDRLASDLVDAKWRSWPRDEVHAIDRFVGAWMWSTLGSDVRANARDVFTFAHGVGVPPDIIAADVPRLAIDLPPLEIARLVVSAFPRVPDDYRAAFVGAFREPRVIECLEAAFFASNAPREQAELSSAIELLRA